VLLALSFLPLIFVFSFNPPHFPSRILKIVRQAVTLSSGITSES